MITAVRVPMPPPCDDSDSGACADDCGSRTDAVSVSQRPDRVRVRARNHIERDEDQARVRQAYGEAAYRRLTAVKDTYDPANVFQLNHNIRPSSWLT